MSQQPSASIASRFQEMVRQHGERIAVADNRGVYTYRELSDLCDRVCRSLLAAGAQRGDIVALLFEQGRPAVAATLGILKAGCSFVPLDGDDPDARLRLIVDDCEPSFAVTNGKGTSKLDQFRFPAERIIDLDADQAPAGADSGPVDVPGDALAYIMYTSGSTGRPKGVCQTHGNFLHFVDVYTKALKAGSGDRFSMLFTMTFSAANLDIFSALLSGASLHLFNTRKAGLSALRGWLEGEGITVLHAPPTVIRHVLKTAPDGFRFKSVRAVDIAGEPLYPSDVPLLRRRLPGACLCFNHLAATEANVICLHEIRLDSDYSGARIPVGRPAPGLDVRIMKDDGSRAGNGEVGEIIVRGPYVAAGYWNRPDLNEQKFAVGDDGVREYRSGDFGFEDESGEIHYIGRSDTRVKVRGHTIDVAEIESVLNGHDGIETAVVVAISSMRDAAVTRLTAHVVLKPRAAVTEPALRDFLRERVPQYMLPGHVIFTDAVPLTDSGKFDRKKLEEQTVNYIRNHSASFDHRTDSTQRVTRLFSRILERADVDPDRGFFEQGGDSLGMTDLVETMEKDFNMELGSDLLGRDVSVSQLVERLNRPVEQTAEARRGGAQAVLVPLKPDPELPNMFIVHGRNGRPFVSPHVLGILGSRFSVCAIRARGCEAGEQPHFSIEGMAADYIQAIRQVQPDGPYFLAGLCAGGVVAIEMAVQLRHVGAGVAPVITLDPTTTPAAVRDPGSRRRRMEQLLTSYADAFSPGRDSLRSKLKKQKDKGSIDIDDHDPGAVTRTSKVMTAFAMALTSYQPHGYDGDVMVIGSYRRLQFKRRGNDTFVRGNLHYFCVGAKHGDAIDSTNAQFRDALTECIDHAVRSVSASPPDAGTRERPGSDVESATRRFQQTREGARAIRAARRRKRWNQLSKRIRRFTPGL